jgi:hypothetical protein
MNTNLLSYGRPTNIKDAQSQLPGKLVSLLLPEAVGCTSLPEGPAAGAGLAKSSSSTSATAASSASREWSSFMR